MLGKILTVDGPVQAPEPDDGVGQQHLHTKLDGHEPFRFNGRGTSYLLASCANSEGGLFDPDSSNNAHVCSKDLLFPDQQNTGRLSDLPLDPTFVQ
jgi:hypothetical protein